MRRLVLRFMARRDVIPARIYLFLIGRINFITMYALKLKKAPMRLLRFAASVLPEPVSLFVKRHEFFAFALKFAPLGSSPRWYIRKQYSLEAFFAELNARGVRYVILRWWETLPEISPGEDVDLLIQDDDFYLIAGLVTRVDQGQKLDIYTVGGGGAGAFNGLAYYPKKMATDLILNRTLFRGRYYVPSDELYFYSMLYHVLFHKGLSGNLLKSVEHDYLSILEDIAAKAFLKFDPDLEAMCACLESKGYFPSPDLLTKIVSFNSAVSALVSAAIPDPRGGEYGLFVIRARALEKSSLPRIEEHITNVLCMDVLRVVSLDSNQIDFLKDNMRGGNWGRGPYPESGGDPVVAMVVYDYHPAALDSKLSLNYEFFTNANFLKAKFSLRNALNRGRFYLSHYNGVHSTDNEHEARFFLIKLFGEGFVSDLMAELDAVRSEYYTDFKVIKLLSKGRRSKVELIDYHGKPAIKKTFRRGFEAYFDRELVGYQELSEAVGGIPKLLEVGSRSFVSECFDLLEGEAKLAFFRENKNKVIDLFESFYKAGYAHINLTPDNVLVCRDGVLHPIDFEFLYRYQSLPSSVLASYDVAGVPDGVEIDVPRGYSQLTGSFYYNWHHIIGEFKKR